MRGHLQQRGPDSWRLKVFIGKSADGKRRYVERTVRGTRKEAETALARLVVEADEGRYSPSAPSTFGELLDRWLAVKKLAVEPTTLKSYEWVSRTYLRPALATRKVASLRPIDVDTLYSQLHGRALSARTVRICHTVMRQSLEQARKWGLIARSPVVDATPPRHVRAEMTLPTVAQVHQLLEATAPRLLTSVRICGSSLPQAAGAGKRVLCGGATSTSTAVSSASAEASSTSAATSSRRTPRPTSPAALPSTRQR